MTTRTSIISAALVAVPLFMGIGVASAQQQPQQSPAPDHQMMHHDPMMHMCRDLDARLAGKLAYEETRLGITEAQRPAWHKLADTLKSAQEPVRKVCTEVAGQPAPTTLPTRLERMQKMAEAHAAALRTAVPAIEQFYATLSPDQKRLADDLMGHGMGGHMGMH
jgi:periplasmic protein CpxP/Spy